MKAENGRKRVGEELIGELAAYRMQAGAAEASVVAGAGGLVRKLSLAAKGSESGAIDVIAGPLDSEIAFDPWYRGRILCPFNDRIPDGRYNWGGKSLQLPLNSPEDGSSIHGLVYDRAFTAVEATDADLRLSTHLSRTEVAGYPFDLEITLHYVLTCSSFSLEIAVRNTSTTTAPLAFGWHPYFTLGVPIDGLSLQLDSDRYVPVDEALIPTGEIEPVAGTQVDFRRRRPIGAQSLDLALTAPKGGRIQLSSEVHSLSIELLGNSFRFVQLFTHPSRQAIAIEPVTAATNSFNIPRLGLLSLEPGADCSGGVRITRTA